MVALDQDECRIQHGLRINDNDRKKKKDCDSDQTLELSQASGLIENGPLSQC